MDKGEVYGYVEMSFQKMLSEGNPEGFKIWHQGEQRASMKKKLLSQFRRKEHLNQA